MLKGIQSGWGFRTSMNRSARVRVAVENKYSSLATGSSTSACCGIVSTNVPRSASEVALSCGSPLDHVTLKQGMTLLDVGSGGGIDVFAASPAVGPGGRAIGVDSTVKMVARARRTARENQYANVEFRLGEMENLPVESGTVDVVVSNCAVNLAPSKGRVYAEMFRVLRPGGRLAISDILAEAAIPDAVKNDMDNWSRCISGALTLAGLRRILTRVGFVDFEVLDRKAWDKGKDVGLTLFSATFRATKPIA